MSCCAPSGPRTRSHDPAALSRLPGRPHCRHTGDVPAGMILAACRCLDCDPQPIQARLFSHALVENDLGRCADCGHQAIKLLVGGAGRPDTSLCVVCEPPLSLPTTVPRDLANQERARRWRPPIPRPDPTRSCTAACHYGEQRSMIQASWEESADEPVR
jgi:hypothetical protein